MSQEGGVDGKAAVVTFVSICKDCEYFVRVLLCTTDSTYLNLSPSSRSERQVVALGDSLVDFHVQHAFYRVEIPHTVTGSSSVPLFHRQRSPLPLFINMYPHETFFFDTTRDTAQRLPAVLPPSAMQCQASTVA